MAVVKGDRIANSRRLNRCSFEAHLAYADFVASRVVDDFNRGRLSVGLIVEAMFPRREGERRAIEKKVAAWIEEWKRERLIVTWECDGWIYFELTNAEPRGNRYHRTPEPPWSDATYSAPEATKAAAALEVAEHQHTGACLSSAITQARASGDSAKSEFLSLRLKDLRSRDGAGGGAGAGPGGGPGRGAPSTPSTPSTPSALVGGASQPVENSPTSPPPPAVTIAALREPNLNGHDRAQLAEQLVAYVSQRTGLSPASVKLKASAHYGQEDGRLVRTASFRRMTEAYFDRTVATLSAWCQRLEHVTDAELQAVQEQGDDATLAPVPQQNGTRRRRRTGP